MTDSLLGLLLLAEYAQTGFPRILEITWKYLNFFF